LSVELKNIPAPYELKEISSLQDMVKYISVIHELSGPGLTIDEYKKTLMEMIPNGYGQVAVLENEKCIAISGYWINTKLYSGKYLEMDNVIVIPEYRSNGIGKLLCNWCEQKAKDNNCRVLMLDAYLENEKAHKFYEREGYFKRGYHFLKKIK
jgi:GNAT superfamily N-acetyltransferase